MQIKTPHGHVMSWRPCTLDHLGTCIHRNQATAQHRDNWIHKRNVVHDSVVLVQRYRTTRLGGRVFPTDTKHAPLCSTSEIVARRIGVQRTEVARTRASCADALLWAQAWRNLETDTTSRPTPDVATTSPAMELEEPLHWRQEIRLRNQARLTRTDHVQRCLRVSPTDRRRLAHSHLHALHAGRQCTHACTPVL